MWQHSTSLPRCLQQSVHQHTRGRGGETSKDPADVDPLSGPLQTTHSHHAHNTQSMAEGFRQQLPVKAAEEFEDLTADWVSVNLQGVALQGQHEDALFEQALTY